MERVDRGEFTTLLGLLLLIGAYGPTQKHQKLYLIPLQLLYTFTYDFSMLKESINII